MQQTFHAFGAAALLAAAVLGGCAAQPGRPTPATTAAFVPESGKVHEFALDNGLKILVKEDHRAPVVVAQIWYKVGASYEHNGVTGVSHVLEHMMFKGTDKLGPNEFSRIIAEQGGRENAFTGDDYTAYFQQLEASRLGISFELEADRMQNMRLDPAEFAKEIKVVMEERRMRTEDNPVSLAYETFKAAAFQTSPYHHPVIGWMDDLKNMHVDDLQRWYQAWYAPNNAVLVVVGAVNPQQVLALAQRTYGKVPARPVQTVKPQVEAPQSGIRRITVKAPAELPHLFMGYKVPVLKTAPEEWEVYALDMLASILDGGESARFAKHLVRGSQIAASAGAGYQMTSRLDDLFVFDGTPARGRTITELEQSIREQIERIKTEAIDPAELDRIRTQVVASKEYEKDSVYYQAMQMGMLETVGLDWRMMDEYVDKLRAVTAEQVQAVARKYLVDDRLTVAVLDPQPLDNNAPRRMGGGSHGRH